MPSPRVFVSSTAYDLGSVRESIRSLIRLIGYEPVLSEYSDILYDPRHHTHTSCVKEVESADIIVLIIGSRFGGAGIAEARGLVDFDKLKSHSTASELIAAGEGLSITQLEVLHALNCGVPLFTFVERQVLHDHLVFQKNRGREAADSIIFPSIQDQKSAKYIFEFIDFLRLAGSNNAVLSFSSLSDIESQLKAQWAMYFQRLLGEERRQSASDDRLDKFTAELEDLKSAVLSVIPQADLRRTARGVMQYRQLVDLLEALGVRAIPDGDPAETLAGVLSAAGISEIVLLAEHGSPRRQMTLLIFPDGTCIRTRLGLGTLHKLSMDYDEFIQLTSAERDAIFGAVQEASPSSRHFLRMSRSLTRRVLNETSYTREIRINVDELARSGESFPSFSDFSYLEDFAVEPEPSDGKTGLQMGPSVSG